MREAAGIAAVAALALAGALDYAQFLAEYSRSGDRSGMVAQEARFRDAIVTLPPGGIVGYVSDVPPGEAQGQAMLGAAQYALAPRLLVPLKPAGNPDYAAGGFARPDGAARAATEHGLSVVADYGNGVVVFRKGTRP